MQALTLWLTSRLRDEADDHNIRRFRRACIAGVPIAIMRLAIMQPYFVPYIGYFQLMSAVDKIVLLDDVNFINGGWINRNRIAVNGQPALADPSARESKPKPAYQRN